MQIFKSLKQPILQGFFWTPLVVFWVSGGMSEGARPFPLKIFYTKISLNSTSGECINLLLKASFFLKHMKYAPFWESEILSYTPQPRKLLQEFTVISNWLLKRAKNYF